MWSINFRDCNILVTPSIHYFICMIVLYNMQLGNKFSSIPITAFNLKILIYIDVYLESIRYIIIFKSFKTNQLSHIIFLIVLKLNVCIVCKIFTLANT